MSARKQFFAGPDQGQLSFLDEPRQGQRQRVVLDEASWVEHVPRWLSDDAALLATLTSIPSWEQRSRWMYTRTVIEPRLTAEYPILNDAPIARLREIGAALSAELGVPYDRAWLNLYRDHNDGTAWHADKPCRRAECIVPVLSLGATRRFLIRPKPGGRSTTFVVRSGDLIVMGGRCQRDWVHSVPKESSPSGPRISVNFSSKTQAAADDSEE
jgi:alkylated DNA repair dioxygenase AlkB